MELDALLSMDAEPEADAAVFVSDASAEAERVAQALRARGYAVVDVPLAMLVARVVVQRPRAVVLDGDGDGARDTAARLRALASEDDDPPLAIVLLGGEPEAPEGTQRFPRPVDAQALVARIVALTGGPRVGSGGGATASGAPPPQHTSSLPPPSMRREPTSSRPPAAPRHTPVVPSVSLRPVAVPHEAAQLLPKPGSRASRSVAGPLSPEVESLLHEAEERAQSELPAESQRPSPDEEIDAVLPPDILASLDEPLVDEDVEEALNESLAAPRRDSARHVTRRGATTGVPLSDVGGLTPGPKTHGGPPGAMTTGAHLSGAPVVGGPTAALPEERAASQAPSATLAPEMATGAPATAAGTVARSAPPTFGAEPATGGRPALGNHGSFAPLAYTEPPPLAAPTAPPPEGDSEVRGASMPSARGAALADGGAHLARLVGRPSPKEAPGVPGGRYVPSASVLAAGDAARALGHAIGARATAVLAFTSRGADAGVVRRVVLRDGDVITAASAVDAEGLVPFLGVRGDIPREAVARLASKVQGAGRHAGAALVAHGYLRQDQLWDALRAHAEWVLARVVQLGASTLASEDDPPQRLIREPGVFGAATGAAVFVEIVRRVVPPEEALARLGGPHARVADGMRAALTGECGLESATLEAIERARGRSVDEATGSAEIDLGPVLLALDLLGVVEIVRPAFGGAAPEADVESADDIDEEAVRARVKARLQLVDEGDYFAVLGLRPDATAYDVRRAFLELRRAFDPARLLTPAVADLDADVRKIVLVLEEAYDILRDGARRERYRRAIGAPPANARE